MCILRPDEDLRSEDQDNSLGSEMIGHPRQEHRAPLTAFSADAFSQLQWRAFSLPQEHLAWEAGVGSALLDIYV